ncbi:MAG TPA: hypothetical protein PLF22_00910 [Pseudomonadales bacterium]|nr:hypothetical protein [Pseudomonadales bacterium]
MTTTSSIRLLFVMTLLFGALGVSVLTIQSPTEITSEKRKLADLGALPASLAEAQQFFQRVDAWSRDRMHFRQQWITAFNQTRFDYGFSPPQDVVIGKERWLFYSGQSELDDALGATQFTPAELARWEKYLRYRKKQAAEYGAEFLFVLLPNKSTVYPEYLPGHFSRVSNQTRLSQLSALMVKLDIGPVGIDQDILKAKQHGQLYLKNDTHWNLLGANYAQKAIADRLSKIFPDIKPKLFPFHEASAEERKQLHHPNDLYYMLGIPGEEIDREPSIPVVEGIGNCVGKNDPGNMRVWPLALGDCSVATHLPEDPAWFSLVDSRWGHLSQSQRNFIFRATHLKEGKHTLLIVHDSYFEMLQPYLSNQFGHAYYVWLGRPLDMTAWPDLIEAAKPDVIIEENLERYLKSITPRAGVDYPDDGPQN